MANGPLLSSDTQISRSETFPGLGICSQDGSKDLKAAIEGRAPLLPSWKKNSAERFIPMRGSSLKEVRKIPEDRPGGSTTESRPALTQLPPRPWNCNVRMAIGQSHRRQKQCRRPGLELQTLTWGLWPSITSPQPTRWGPVTGGKPTDWLTPISSAVESNGLSSADLDAGGWNTEQALAGSLLASCCCHLPPPPHLSLSPHLPASGALSVFHIVCFATLPLPRF